MSLRPRLSNGEIAGLAPYDCRQNSVTRPASSDHCARHKQWRPGHEAQDTGAEAAGPGPAWAAGRPRGLDVIAAHTRFTHTGRGSAGSGPCRPAPPPRAGSRCRHRRHAASAVRHRPVPSRVSPRQPVPSLAPTMAPGTRSLNTSPSKAQTLETEVGEEDGRRRKNSHPLTSSVSASRLTRTQATRRARGSHAAIGPLTCPGPAQGARPSTRPRGYTLRSPCPARGARVTMTWGGPGGLCARRPGSQVTRAPSHRRERGGQHHGQRQGARRAVESAGAEDSPCGLRLPGPAPAGAPVAGPAQLTRGRLSDHRDVPMPPRVTAGMRRDRVWRSRPGPTTSRARVHGADPRQAPPVVWRGEAQGRVRNGKLGARGRQVRGPFWFRRKDVRGTDGARGRRGVGTRF